MQCFCSICSSLSPSSLFWVGWKPLTPASFATLLLGGVIKKNFLNMLGLGPQYPWGSIHVYFTMCIIGVHVHFKEC